MMEQTPHLCEDIVIEILAKLPAKSLVRSMAVCKLWKSIITNPQFSLDSKRPHKISIHTNQECYTFLEDENLLGFETDFPLKNNLHKKYWDDNPILMGSDKDGLLCIGTRNPNTQGSTYRVIIWNPCIRRHVLIPQHPIDDHVFEYAHGFGGTISGSDYKYVRIVGFRVDAESYWMVNAFEVYSLKTRTWRPRYFLDYESYRCKGFESTGALLRGRLHFIVSGKRDGVDGIYYCNSIASFELEDEVLEEDIMLPECLSSSGLFDKICLQLTLIKESLGVVAKENMEPQIYSVWVMEEYGDVNSWINMCNIDLTMENTKRSPRNMVGLLKNGDLLLGLWSLELNVKLPPKLVTYNVETRITSDFGVGVLSSSEFCGFANCYKESLVLLADEYHAVADHEVLSMSEQCLVKVHPSWFS